MKEQSSTSSSKGKPAPSSRQSATDAQNPGTNTSSDQQPGRSHRGISLTDKGKSFLRRASHATDTSKTTADGPEKTDGLSRDSKAMLEAIGRWQAKQ